MTFNVRQHVQLIDLRGKIREKIFTLCNLLRGLAARSDLCNEVRLHAQNTKHSHYGIRTTKFSRRNKNNFQEEIIFLYLFVACGSFVFLFGEMEYSTVWRKHLNLLIIIHRLYPINHCSFIASLAKLEWVYQFSGAGIWNNRNGNNSQNVHQISQKQINKINGKGIYKTI